MKFRSVIALACAAMAIGYGHADATKWEDVYYDGNVAGFVDVDSIQKNQSQDIRKAWVKFTDKEKKGLFLISVSKDGQVCLMKAGKTNTIENIAIPAEYEYIEPETPLSYVYDKIWPVKERKIKKMKIPNRWELKGEHTAERAADRVIDRCFRKMGLGWY